MEKTINVKKIVLQNLVLLGIIVLCIVTAIVPLPLCRHLPEFEALWRGARPSGHGAWIAWQSQRQTRRKAPSPPRHPDSERESRQGSA